MPGFLKKKRTWIGLLLVIVLAVGFMPGSYTPLTLPPMCTV